MLYADIENHVLYVDEETYAKIMSTEKNESWHETAFKSLRDQGVDCLLIQGIPLGHRHIKLTTEYILKVCKCSECRFLFKKGEDNEART